MKPNPLLGILTVLAALLAVYSYLHRKPQRTFTMPISMALGIDVPADAIFTSDSGGKYELDKKVDPGSDIVWVKVPVNKDGLPDHIYMFYGDRSRYRPIDLRGKVK